MKKIYIVEADSMLNGGVRVNYHVLGFENAVAEYNECKMDGQCPILYETFVAHTGLIMKSKKIEL